MHCLVTIRRKKGKKKGCPFRIKWGNLLPSSFRLAIFEVRPFWQHCPHTQERGSFLLDCFSVWASTKWTPPLPWSDPLSRYFALEDAYLLGSVYFHGVSNSFIVAWCLWIQVAQVCVADPSPSWARSGIWTGHCTWKVALRILVVDMLPVVGSGSVYFQTN